MTIHRVGSEIAGYHAVSVISNIRYHTPYKAGGKNYTIGVD